MKQDDYFLKQIDVLGKVLSRILGRILGLKNDGEIIDLELENQELKAELNVDLKEFLSVPKEGLADFLRTEKRMKENNLEKFSEIVFLLAMESHDLSEKTELLDRALSILEDVDEKSSIFSMERMNLMDRIKKEKNT